MKILVSICLWTCLVLVFSACEHNVSMETTVHDDGTIDKIIILETADTTKNFLGISTQNGWNLTTHLIEDSAREKQSDRKWRATFEKTFSSAQQATQELASFNDTLFHVSSTYEKNFKWFYTYLYYADTYNTINRMEYPMDDYLTPEDFTFINRLPAEGEVISKADSLYLSRLQEKIFDVYGTRAIFEAHYQLNEKLIHESGLEQRWIDTLKKHKEDLYKQLVEKKDGPEDSMFKAMDSLGIPLPFDKIRSRYDELYQLEEGKTNFINHASEGKYTHIINMPWSMVNTNADSVAGNRLQWNPPSIKFLLKDYTMYAEARRANIWAFIVSIMVLILAGYLLWRRKP
jgi:hypothetical protein